jgi:hypothetical protein
MVLLIKSILGNNVFPVALQHAAEFATEINKTEAEVLEFLGACTTGEEFQQQFNVMFSGILKIQ